MARGLVRVDRGVFTVLLVTLAASVLLFGRANILADSVDYYFNLQRISPAAGAPIVRNPHFASQRSPGFSLAALPLHLFLVYVMDPVVGTTPGVLPPAAPAGPPGMIPSQPLLLHQLPFHDYPVPGENSRFDWKVALALALTSYGFLLAGLLAVASALRRAYPELPGYSLIAVLLLGSPILVQNIFAMPLYATLTAFGASALFGSRFLRAAGSGRPLDGVAAGAWLGLVVLTRLEMAVFAAALAALLLIRRRRALCLRILAGASWAAVAWAAYNWRVFGTLVSFEILRGDINVLRFEFGYILRCLVHPASGILFWSSPICLGLLGLLAGRSAGLRWLGVATLPLVAVWVLRVPVMVLHPDGAPLSIAGLPVMPPLGQSGALQLIRSDMNRYATVLAPFAVIGLRDLVGRLSRRRPWSPAISPSVGA